MKYYKDSEGTVYGYEAGDQDEFISLAIENGWEDITASWPPAPAIDQTIVWEAIKAERDRRIVAGGYRVGDKWFHSDILSRTQQIGLVMMGSSIPDGLQWKTMDGSFVAMTPQLAGQIFAAAAASDQAIFAAAEAHRAMMAAGGDPGSYDYAAGWPPMFGE